MVYISNTNVLKDYCTYWVSESTRFSINVFVRLYLFIIVLASAISGSHYYKLVSMQIKLH
jgi:hypothetical protein